MVKIISDTCTLYDPEKAKAIGLDVTPLYVNVNDKSYREYVDITSDELLKMIEEGAIPQSSQPSIGEKVKMYEEYDGEIIDITIAQGLSGTYDSALIAKESVSDPGRITVINSMTLCGPQKALVDEALKMARDGRSKDEIVTMLDEA